MDEQSEVDDSRNALHRGASDVPSRLWLAGCVALLALIGVYWARIPGAERFRPPTSPLDRVPGLNAETRFGWGFLWQVREVLAPGAIYTVVAAEPETEMSLYMTSRAVLPEQVAMPSSYYLRPSVETGAAARYVLVYRCAVKPAGATMVQQLDDGCVWDRGAR